MEIKATLSEFVELNLNLIVDDCVSKSRDVKGLKPTWGSRIARIALQSLNTDDIDVDLKKSTPYLWERLF